MSVTQVLGKAFLKVFKSSSERYVKKREDFVVRVNELESEFAALTDSQLQAKTAEFRTRIRELEEKIIGPDLRAVMRSLRLMPEEPRRPAKKQLTEQLQVCCEDILADAFAAVREASDRHLGIRNVFSDQYKFDPSILSADMKSVFDAKQQQIADGADVHKIELPPEFYAEIRGKYPWQDRPPFRFRHFDVQLIGGRALYEGTIAEMATGEGKTLVATLAAYVVAISGRKVHIITVNDYLAKRDRDWMGPVYESLGLTVGAIQSDMDTAGDERRQQYACDITHGTNNEFGFDFLRDNMKVSYEDQVQGYLDYVIIDEVDSILIDEARTPLIISGPARDDVSRYKAADQIARELIRAQGQYNSIQSHIDSCKRQVANLEGELSESKKVKDSDRQAKIQKQIEGLRDDLTKNEAKLEKAVQYYEVEYDRRSVHLTHEGVGLAQDKAGVGSFFVGSNMEWPHLMEQALRAHVVYEKEKEYVVQDGEVIIVDEFTGRLMHGRQWSDGLHQAVEAKENVTVKEETQTLATITIQNFFKLYQQIAGMTGTAMTEADEFMKIYQLNAVAIPTNKPVVRDDMDDLIYKTIPEKFNAIVDEIHEVSRTGRPLLIGTISIEKNEALSAALTKKYGVDHEVLNAKQHAREATIVAKAGQQHQRRDGSTWGNITIATNMAGRGTDIKLGTGVEVLGGLHVLGTERHEARRIDNQLRGRSGRQGDKGSSQFFLSFQDELLMLFGGERMLKLISLFRWPEGEPMVHKKLSAFVEKTQKKVEERNFEARKSLLEYDEVMDYQRQVFYTRRQSILEGLGLERIIWEMIEDTIAETCAKMLDKYYPYECIAEWARTNFGVDLELDRIVGQEPDELETMIRDHARNNADQDINVTLGEYMSTDMESDEWDLKGLSKWAMSRFAVNVSQHQLRKMTPEEVQEHLIAAANEQIEKMDCARLGTFLEELFGIKSLCDWFNQKFDLKVSAEALSGKKTSEVEQVFLDEARQAYRRREIEYPVDYILNMALRRAQSGSSFAAKDICDWAKYKYRAELKVDEVQALSYDKIRKRLLDLNESFYDGRLREEIEGQMGACRWDDEGKKTLADWANERYRLELSLEDLSEEDAADVIGEKARLFLRRELTELEKYVLLQIYDSSWKDHLYAMDHMKSGIGLRGFAEKDPKLEYKREGYRMFQEMLSGIRDKVTGIIFKAQLEGSETMRSVWNISQSQHADFSSFEEQQAAAQASQGEQKVKTIKLEQPKVGRNDPCPCGSGKKYKKCCGLKQ